jgi:hypothetical protein
MATAKNSNWSHYFTRSSGLAKKSVGRLWKGLFRANMVRHTEPGKHEDATQSEAKFFAQRFKSTF